MAKRKLRAIDLYSGVGGWSLGLRLAGIDVVGSYEIWAPANETNFKNNHHNAQTVDIRRLSLNDLPSNIDVVVGSPPCTQFSFSNRGGGGDIADGLEDMKKFLEIVAHVKPKWWVMENVPRVEKIIHEELKPGGTLSEFRHLGLKTRVFDMEELGLPQRRKRCLAGNIDMDLLASYADHTPRRTLGDVVTALSKRKVTDPIYGFSIPRARLRDHVLEEGLNTEEIRINRAGKRLHPVYNSMPFPDPLNRSVRTITATCTRVSRESVIIRDPKKSQSYRRLTLRERACLQGFPATFQFYGSSYSQKQRMIGNALPPLFAFYLAQAMRGTEPSKLPTLTSLGSRLVEPSPLPTESVPDRRGAKFPASRTFCFAIPSLRLKSGVRFQLVNQPTENDEADWLVQFFFGNSKAIHTLEMGKTLQTSLSRRLPNGAGVKVRAIISDLACYVQEADIKNMQRIWSHRGLGRTRPFMLLDKLDEVGGALIAELKTHQQLCEKLVSETVATQHVAQSDMLVGLGKLQKHAPVILAGLLVGSTVNAELLSGPRQAARRVSER